MIMKNKKVIGIGASLLLVAISYLIWARFFSQGGKVSNAIITGHNSDLKTVDVKIGSKTYTYNYSNPEISMQIPSCDCSIELAGMEYDKLGTAYGVWITIDGTVYNTLSW